MRQDPDGEEWDCESGGRRVGPRDEEDPEPRARRVSRALFSEVLLAVLRAHETHVVLVGEQRLSVVDG